MRNLSIFLYIALLCVAFPLQGQQTPDSFFNVAIGADKTLVAYPRIVQYLEYLASESPRVKISYEGKSTLGNDMVLAIISSKENIDNLTDLLDVNKRLTDPTGLTEEEAANLIEKSKVFVLVTATIHADEIAASQMAMLWAYQLAVDRSTVVEEILRDVVILVMPSINPDGNILVTDWYKKNLGTPHEGCRMPYLYHHYAGHDTNRDFYMLNLKETRVVNHVLHHKYYPHIFLDMHQMGITGPRMFVPPFKDPLNKNLDPRLVRETNLIGSFMAMKLQEAGKQGVANAYGFDAYWPGGSKNTAWFKNVVGVLTEAASVQVAGPVFVDPNELSSASKGLPEYKAQVNFPDPWPGGWWRLRDIIDYELIAANALIELAAKNRRSFVSNFYAVGRDNCEEKNNQKVFGYVIPPDQWDLPTAYSFLEKMEEHGVKIFSFTDDHAAGGTIYKKGTFVIPLNQPYRDFIQVMMEKQVYPEIVHMEGGPIMEPYDSAGWTMPLQMGIAFEELPIPTKGLPVARVTGIGCPAETVAGESDGAFYLLSARYNNSFLAVNRLFKQGVPVFRIESAPDGERRLLGSFLVKCSDIKGEFLKSLLTGTGIKATCIAAGSGIGLFRVKPPAIAIYQSYIPRIDEGWTRFVLDQFEFPYAILHNKDFGSKKQLARYDVIVFPDMTRSMIVDGVVEGRYSYYYRNVHPDFKGGIGARGLGNLKEFVREGGHIVVMDSASTLAIDDFELPLINILKNTGDENFSCPGSLLKMYVDVEDPLGWGLPSETALLFFESAAFKTFTPQDHSVTRSVTGYFSPEGPHLLSGYLKGEKKLNRAAMILHFGFEQGHVIVLGGRVQYRGQTSGTYKFLFNSLYFQRGSQPD